jgi:hypothetical protein
MLIRCSARAAGTGDIEYGGAVNGAGYSTGAPLHEAAWFQVNYQDVYQFVRSGATRVSRTALEDIWRWQANRALGGEVETITCRLRVTNEYTTAQLIADTTAKLLPYSAGFTKRAIDDSFMRNLNYSGAQRTLSALEDEFSSSKVKYRFVSFPSIPP